MNIGLFGFGTVGKGLYDVLNKINLSNVQIKKVCIKDISKPRDVILEFTDNEEEIFGDKDINFIVELIDDAEAAYSIVKRALTNGIPVVSGNKKMLAYHVQELIELQKQHGTALLYDASACGSIPVIRNLEEYYNNELLTSVKGILNGSSNFILSKIFNEGMNYQDALKLAQNLGFAESNPTLDIDGWDSLFKLIIITVHAFGVYVHPDKIFNYGISSLNDNDIKFAEKEQRRIKLVACAEKQGDNLVLSVMPHLISRQKYIYSVEDEFNGVVIKGLFYYKQFMFGRGAGGWPTGSAVLSDITAQLYDYKYEYRRQQSNHKLEYTSDVPLRVYSRYTKESHLKLLNFENITEKYTSEDFNYIVATVSLEQLLEQSEVLRKEDIFIALYPKN